MPVAILNRNRIQDQLDANLTLGAGTDGYAITWDNATGKFVMAAAATAPFVDSTAIVKGSSDATKQLRFEVGGFTSGATRVLTPPNQNGTIAILEQAQTFTAEQTYNNNLALRWKDSGGTSRRSYLLTSSNVIQFGPVDAGWGSSTLLKAGTSISFQTNGASGSFVTAVFINTTKRVEIGGGTNPAAMLHVVDSDATISAITNAQIIGHNASSGTPAMGMGTGLLIQIASSTTASQNAARLVAKWSTATHASRQAQSDWTVYDYSAERTVVSIGANGSAGLLGFYGVTPVARQTLATGAGASVDDVITALQNLGLVKQS